MKHQTKEAVAALTALGISITMVYIPIAMLILEWSSRTLNKDTDFILGHMTVDIIGTLITSVIIGILLCTGLFQWVRTPPKKKHCQ